MSGTADKIPAAGGSDSVVFDDTVYDTYRSGNSGHCGMGQL